jgi:ubiquinone/menaquinone biosynthesis C-methylase UbiE
MRLLLASLLLLSGCDVVPSAPQVRSDVDVASSEFPKAARPIAPIVSARWSTEEARDKAQEADLVMDIAGTNPGMTVADIGAGEGYYTIRLAARVGKSGRVLAQDVIPKVRDKLAQRVTRDNLDNVSVKLGAFADPKLPVNSFDRIFMVHMYHEISDPFEFLWRLRPALRVGGRAILVDANRPTDKHGTPPALLDCEMNAVGYRRVEFRELPEAGGYLAAYEASGNRPEPNKIKACAQ